MSHNSFLDWGWRIRSVPECASTNAELKAAVESGMDGAGAVLVADRQSRGRGRYDRVWVSPLGNACLSAAIPISDADKSYQHGLIAGLSLAETVSRLAGIPALVKWPNDVLVSGRKLAGILSELAFPPAEDGNPRHPSSPLAIVGVGVNLASTREDFPDDLQGKVVTLKDEAPHIRWERDAFVSEFLQEWRERLRLYEAGGLRSLLPSISSRLAWKGETVRVVENGFPPLRAVLSGVDADGFLIVTLKDGSQHRVVAADVEPESQPYR